MSGENSEVRIKCYKCGNSYTTDQMRYDPDRPARLVCRNCLTKKDQRPSAMSESKAGGKDIIGGMTTYYCIKCHYKFQRRKGMDVPACPYCGSETLTTKTDATSILKKAEDEDFEM